ncbi:BQ2448_447 [Microbotryum intermedium]|uniref:BQ2448_447 protein n=1 Tax=Microbotryum intermedium TaxID=269621 RepID=A0A238FB69_9BASI|nr:BQ2448_447 [Microbotryum intermedium]
MVSDRFFGFQDTALLCDHVISTLFSVGSSSANNASSATPVSVVGGLETPPASPPTTPKDQPPVLGEFIAYALYRTRLPINIIYQALLLLSRLKARYPSARGTSTSPHRLFLSSLMLSSKISMDDTYSNKSWQVVGQGLFSLREVNQMERELFAFLGWNVVVRDEELAAWVTEVVEPYKVERDAASAPVLRKTMEERKRRRDETPSAAALPTPSSSVSRSPSPDSLRHRRASDAAIAMLHGANAAVASSSQRSARHSRRSRTRTPSYCSSPSSSNSSRGSSAYSSSTSSPVSGATTPGSPITPAGPLTPSHCVNSFPDPSGEAKHTTSTGPARCEISSW